MDLLRTLLAYMATTLVVAVESTSTPGVTPEPTPSPTPFEAAQVETVTAVPSLEPTATPAPTASLTPVPVPLITPNTKGYHNLIQGDKGQDVRKLQERLIELGYLPEGAADGAYGRQTMHAVRKFQYYNGLTVDGIAGRSTQTNLFENPDIARNPEQNQEEETEQPNGTPTETEGNEPAEADSGESDEGGPVTKAETPVMILTDAAEAGSPTETAEMEEATAEAAAAAVETPAAEETAAESPAVEAPATAAPASAAPETAVTENSTTIIVETETPATEAPASESPATEAPVTEVPATEAPATEASATETPAEEAPATETPATEAPATETPATEAPATDAPASAAPVTETPAAEAAPETAAPAVEEVVEDVDLDLLEMMPTLQPTVTPEPVEYEDVAGWVVLNDSGESMQWTALEDGVPVVRSPRLQRHEEDIRVSLDDLVASVEEWKLTDEGDSLVLEAQGFVLALLNEAQGIASTVDGLEMMTEPQDFEFSDGHYIRVDFLTRALDGEWEWDEEEETLMLRIPVKNAAGYSD